VRDKGEEPWLAAKLQEKGNTRRVQITTNSFAASCLQGDDVIPESYGNEQPCPFLKDNCCTIYDVRPFSCRCFIESIAQILRIFLVTLLLSMKAFSYPSFSYNYQFLLVRQNH